MISKFKLKFKNKNEIIALSFLILITIISTTYFNYSQKKITDEYRKLKVSMDKITNRSEKIKNLDLEKLPKK